MPFVQRVVDPKYLSRTTLRDENGKPRVTDEELQAVTNCTLSNALRQLASLVLLAEDIFSELTAQLQEITERSKVAQNKIDKINEIVVQYDPKKVPVPEGSLSDFAIRKVHYTASNPLKKGLFTPDTRPPSLRNLYDKATNDRLSVSILDQLRRDSQHSPYLLCTPVLSTKRRRLCQKVDVEIETHIPSVVEHLRRWTSKEAVGEITALTDASMRIASSVTLTPDELSECGSGDDEPIDHRLPSPEEQLRIIASKFPPEVVAIDTSGKFFDRMCSSRKSLHIDGGIGETDTVKRRTRTRKPRDYRHSSADKPYLNIPQNLTEDKGASVDLNAINPTLHRYHTAHLRGRHGVVNYEHSNNTSQNKQQKYWTLPNRTNPEQNIPKSAGTAHKNVFQHPTKTGIADSLQPLEQRIQAPSTNKDSIRISPIDPRSSGPFKSSTPSNKENVVDLSSKMLSPIKSTMTNEELYAVIHKSKKKLNIKDERSESPALSSISLSPVSSETSFFSKGTQRYPETGYLGDPRSRMSWSPADKPTFASPSGFPYGIQKQDTTCADRYGPIPQTSRLDFKKLLLQHSVKLNTLHPQNKSQKLSAVEQLKLSKEKTQVQPVHTANRSQVNILDLSGSPKTYTHRKMIKPNPQSPASPGRTAALIKEHKNSPKLLLSPKSQWRFSSPRSDVLSTPILEAHNEDENSNSSGEKQETPPGNIPSKTVPIVTNQHFGARRNLIPISENTVAIVNDYSEAIDQGVFPLNADFPKSHALSRTEIMQAKRAEFFNSPPERSPPRLTSFKSTLTNSPANTRSTTSPERGKTSPTTLETAL